jgi:hypothetical protein
MDSHLNQTSTDFNEVGRTLDPASLDIMVSALRHNELTEDLSDEDLEMICLDAFAQGQLNNETWLFRRIQNLKENLVDPNSHDPVETLDEKRPTSSLPNFEVSEPASIASPEDLKEVIRLHEIWMNSVLDPRKAIAGGRANLSGANLSGFDLSGVNLSCANLKGTNLTDANLLGANLSRANLEGADLRGANLTDCKLKGARLAGAKQDEATDPAEMDGKNDHTS